MAIFLFPIKPALVKKVAGMKDLRAKEFLTNMSYAVSIVLLVICILSLAGGTYNPFIYFRF